MRKTLHYALGVGRKPPLPAGRRQTQAAGFGARQRSPGRRVWTPVGRGDPPRPQL